MTGVGASFGVAVLLSWVVFALAGWVASPGFAAGLGSVAGAGLMVVFRRSVAIGSVLALLAPVGVMLPALAIRHVAGSLGLPVGVFDAWELVSFVLFYTAFLAAGFGVLPVDLYRLGYAPGPVAVMVLVVCGYGFMAGDWFLPLVAVLGQGAWVMRWGSSNWFDYVLHVVMWPVALVVLLGQIF